MKELSTEFYVASDYYLEYYQTDWKQPTRFIVIRKNGINGSFVTHVSKFQIPFCERHFVQKYISCDIYIS